MLLMDENNSTDSLMLMMMMQTMGNQPFTMDQVKFQKFKKFRILWQSFFGKFEF